MIGWVLLTVAVVVLFGFWFLMAGAVEWMNEHRRAEEEARLAACRLKLPRPTIDDINEQHRHERHADMLERYPKL